MCIEFNMVNHRLFRLALSTSLLWTVSGRASAQTPPTPTQLSVLWEVNVGQNVYTDFMSSVSPAERDQFPFLGAIAYVPSYLSGSPPLYRLSAGRDHMDSTTPGKGGYSTDGPLAYPWTSATAVPGLFPISRVWNTSTGDHATATPVTTSLYPGYQADAQFGFYGYPRFGNSGGSPTAYSAGGVSETSDLVAGGAVSGWSWNGAQFIETSDYGRYMQSDVSWVSNGVTYNPTEAGDHFSGATQGSAGKWHGSPILANQISNGVVLTRSAPLDWGITFPGTTGVPVSPANPYVYTAMQIGKNLTLNFDNLGPVAQYQTVVFSPTAIPASDSTIAEIPTAYLQSNYGSFFTYDAGTNVAKRIAVSSSCSGGAGSYSQFTPASGKGGVIIANASGTAAMGVYGNTPMVTFFLLFDFRSCGGTTKWSAVHAGAVSAGTNTYTTYVTTGTAAEVVTEMRALKQAGY